MRGRRVGHSRLGTRHGLIGDNAITGAGGSGISVDSRETPADDGAEGYGLQISSGADRLHIHGNRVRDTSNNGLNITGTTTEVFRYGNDLRGSSLSDGSSDPVTSPTDLT